MNFSDLIEKISEINSVDIVEAENFINEMASANTSAFYTDDKVEKYRSFNFEALESLFVTDNLAKVRMSMAVNKIKNCHSMVSDVCDYF